MEAELAALAAAGSSAVVQAMATDAWAGVRERVARILAATESGAGGEGRAGGQGRADGESGEGGESPADGKERAEGEDRADEGRRAQEGRPAEEGRHAEDEGRADEERLAAGAAELDLAREKLLAADGMDMVTEAIETHTEAELRARLRRLLAADPGAAAELRDLIAEFAPLADGSPAVTNTITGGTFDAPVVQAGTIQSLTLHHTPEAAKDHIDFRESTFNGTAIGVQHVHAAAPERPRAVADGWPLLGALRLPPGVRPARRLGDETDQPPYVPRDCDPALDRLLAEALRSGGLVVVTGEPLAGKTRTAWEGLKRAAADGTRVCVAHEGTDLGSLSGALQGRDPEGTHVVWLDDLAGHLDEQGRTAGVVSRLTHEGVLVLATMRDEAYATHGFGDHPHARLLRGARKLELTCRWSGPELERLAEAQARDPRLEDAVRWREELGVTQFLAVGPELGEEWRWARRPDGRPWGYELVRAAIDAARCGLRRPLAAPEWRMLLVGAEYGVLLEDEWLSEELSWAGRPRLGVTGLLVPEEGEGGRAWRASGALVADALRSPGFPPPGPYLWRNMTALAQRAGAAELGAVVAAGRAALRASAAAGDADARKVITDLADLAGDEADADRWRGLHFNAVGDREKAFHFLERAASAGHPEGRLDLAALHLVRAEHWLAEAAEDGSPAAAATLAALREALPPNPDTVKE
ncbi:hypothetical protein [Streptomyces sp. SLBN-31]|uniref:hypothetical protein n=1 Tax=Streptomyces sp. SLBN-31 TaxID=2768444 RepID=UPI001151352E|nr:hypothetical protein [Streptomyces sp. SLBN-31]TQJ74545.1 hypothetical protein FBY22_7549 [Streptomyces sp. SLBN-31]